MNKYAKDTIRLLERRGIPVISVERTGGHYKAETPWGTISISSTPSDRKSTLNLLSQARRMRDARKNRTLAAE